MKVKISILFILSFFLISEIYAQNPKTITIVSQTSKYLNSGGRSYLGGVSRVSIRVDLPPNTVQWYYSFTTSPGESGTKMLNLAAQVGATISAGLIAGAVAKNIQVPQGSGSVDVWLMTSDSRDAFESKNDGGITYYKDLSDANTTQDCKLITQLLEGTYYLGLRNPSAMDGVNVTIEVVAVVDDSKAEQDKGKFYGSLGWKAFEKADYAKCIELSKKALIFNPNLSWVKFNIALVHMIQGADESLDEYIDAIVTNKKATNPKGVLEGALKDIQDAKSSKTDIKNIDEIESLLTNELNKY